MKFQYIGGDDAPKSTQAFGHTFKLHGDHVDVTEKEAIRKLQGNPSFLAVEAAESVEPVLLGETTEATEDTGAAIDEALEDAADEVVEVAPAKRGRKAKAA